MKHFQTYLVWIILSIPAVITLYFYVTDIWSYGKALAVSGDWSIWLLILVLAIRPLVRLFPKVKAGRFLMKYRRALGVAVFGYAALHTLIYLFYRADVARILREALGPDLLAGWVALIIFMVLAYTSRNMWIRKLGKRWALLHRLIYPAAIIVDVHWVLTAFDPKSAYIHLGVIIVLLGLRLLPKARRRS